ncbi:MAG: isochorismate synthase [Actinophytocola sp.]|uniref:isochorismate synthase n=1 Tax=Actinophytocola sp. TaxID=1872138 RepID=UPI001324B236|nr:isochorismate synthase [Actinophytocola sp.]MPZ81509.1 isochorismate synthase [Actinophytocola sp.]
MTLGLIADYRPGSFLLASPSRALLATGVQNVVTEPDPDELAAKVTKLLVDSDAPVAVGALPFDCSVGSASAPHVVLPRTVRWSGPIHPTGIDRPAVPAVVETVPVPGPADHERGVAKAVERLRAGELDKVVLARALRLHLAGPVAVGPLLANLAADNATGYTYAVDLPAAGGRRTLVGATPEMLLSRTGPVVVANPLAGTIPRHPDPEQDRLAAEELAASAKDIDEHRVVIETVVEALRPFCRTLTVPDGPSLISTSAVWHLSTRLTGELIDPGISSLRLACALHPTPAVCGRPFDRAKATIAEIEPFDRGFYAGAIGWCDADGDGQWVVGIRCAEIAEPAPGARSTVTLYAGGGIMPASQPHLELAETSAKFRTLLRAMGMD